MSVPRRHIRMFNSVADVLPFLGKIDLSLTNQPFQALGIALMNACILSALSRRSVSVTYVLFDDYRTALILASSLDEKWYRMMPSLSRVYILGLLMPTMAAASVTGNVIHVHG